MPINNNNTDFAPDGRGCCPITDPEDPRLIRLLNLLPRPACHWRGGRGPAPSATPNRAGLENAPPAFDRSSTISGVNRVASEGRAPPPPVAPPETKNAPPTSPGWARSRRAGLRDDARSRQASSSPRALPSPPISVRISGRQSLRGFRDLIRAKACSAVLLEQKRVPSHPAMAGVAPLSKKRLHPGDRFGTRGGAPPLRSRPSGRGPWRHCCPE